MTYDQIKALYGPTQQDIGRKLGVKQNTVSDWKTYGIPYRTQCLIQVASKGKLKASK